MKRGILLVLLVVVIGLPGYRVQAHGVTLTYTLTPIAALRVDLQASTTDGVPLAEEPVEVYAPGSPDVPWWHGETDAAGRFTLLPDAARAGTWEVHIAGEDREATLRLPFAFEAGRVHPLLDTGISLTAVGMGVTYTVREVLAIEVAVDAAFESGEVMDGAQVTVYAPDDPKTPWLTGACDATGRFTFTADPDRPGTWEIQVRKAGHGEWLKIALDADAVEIVDHDAATPDEDAQSLQIAGETVTGGDTGFSTGQVMLMAGSVIWGLIGTALYFSRRRDASRAEGD